MKRSWRAKHLLPLDHWYIRADHDITCEMQVEPDGRGWRWTVEYLIDGRPNYSMYTECLSRRWPRPQTVSGWCRNQGDAWAMARRSVGCIRSVVAAAHDHKSRTFSDSVAL